MSSSVFDDLIDATKQMGTTFGQAFRGESGQDGAPTPEIYIDMSDVRPGSLVAMTCPKCGASIQAPASQNMCYCTYCGTQLLVDDGSATVTYRTVDEAKIRELETKTALELKRLELEEKRRPGKIKATIVLALLGAVMLIGGYFLGDASGGSNAWYMVAILGYFPLLAIPFMWLSGKNSDDDS